MLHWAWKPTRQPSRSSPTAAVTTIMAGSIDAMTWAKGEEGTGRSCHARVRGGRPGPFRHQPAPAADRIGGGGGRRRAGGVRSRRRRRRGRPRDPRGAGPPPPPPPPPPGTPPPPRGGPGPPPPLGP